MRKFKYALSNGPDYAYLIVKGTIALQYFSTKSIVNIIHGMEISDLVRTAHDVFRCR